MVIEGPGSFAKLATGSSKPLRKLALFDPPPSLDAGELTDKGSINRRKVLANRAATVNALYEGIIDTISV